MCVELLWDWQRFDAKATPLHHDERTGRFAEEM